ncbi:3'-5' exonuclease [Algoriphagus lutimaris]|uniref:3'-5' exonuclease n=1 Tax=Algoriphagus lutimaris TaxID=613197 RepID=UPI00196B8F7F|nr:3'-5' exonuclease [Algoriphagus lutimaris]MBN3520780.1 3'-5' exonuclease [Algoriphagus lutimaris]
MSWSLFRKKISPKSFVKDFLKEFKSDIPDIRQFDELTFVVLDTETTGLDLFKDHILSFGAVKIQEQKILISTAVEWYLASSKTGKEAITVHGLLKNEEELSLESFATQMLPYLGNHVIIGHSIGFDLAMLKKALRPFGLVDFPNPSIDTKDLAIRLDHGLMVDPSRINFQDYTLDSLCQRFKIETDDRHTAGGDAFLTANLFLKLLKLACKKGINNWGQLKK